MARADRRCLRMPPAKKKKQPAASAEPTAKLVLPEEREIAEAKLTAGELRARLWDEGLISAELPNGKQASKDTPWSACALWRCLCSDKPNDGESCEEIGWEYENNGKWKTDGQVDKAIEQHYERKHFKRLMEMQPALLELVNKSPLMKIKVLGSFVNLNSTLGKVCTPGYRTKRLYPDA